MSDPNIPPLPPLLCLHLASNTPGHTEEQMRAYGLLCLRQGAREAAMKCVTTLDADLDELHTSVGDEYGAGIIRGLENAAAKCEQIANWGQHQVAASDSPK